MLACALSKYYKNLTFPTRYVVKHSDGATSINCRIKLTTSRTETTRHDVWSVDSRRGMTTPVVPLLPKTGLAGLPLVQDSLRAVWRS